MPQKTLTPEDAKWLERLRDTLAANEVRPCHSRDDFARLGELVAQLKGEAPERTAVIVTVGKIVEKVFVRESTVLAIWAAEKWMIDDHHGGNLADMKETLNVHGYYEYIRPDLSVVAFQIAPAEVN